jgi:hypothetical protein
MNRTIKDATVKRYHYESHGELVSDLDDFVACLQLRPKVKLNPLQQMPGLNAERIFFAGLRL